MEDIYILTRLQRNDEVALAELIEEYKAYVNTIVYQIIGSVMSSQDVEEVRNDVFLKLWNSASKIDLEKGSIKNYISAIARNTAKNKLRELKDITLPIQDLDIISTKEVSDYVEENELTEIIVKALKSLKPVEMQIFIRYYYFYEPISKISGEMKINKNAIKSVLKRGRQKLKKFLLNKEED